MQNTEKPNKIRVKRALGQNFLKSQSALKQIIEAGDLKKDEIVLEIGPGKGALTEKILETGAILFAIEKDRELIAFLEKKFQKYIENKSFFLIEGDVLDLNIKEILKNVVSKSIAQAGEPSIAIRHQANMRVFKKYFLFARLFSRSDYCFRYVLWNRVITQEFHSKSCSTFCHRTQVRHVSEHFRKRYNSFYNFVHSSLFHTFDKSTF